MRASHASHRHAMLEGSSLSSSDVCKRSEDVHAETTTQARSSREANKSANETAQDDVEQYAGNNSRRGCEINIVFV